MAERRSASQLNRRAFSRQPGPDVTCDAERLGLSVFAPLSSGPSVVVDDPPLPEITTISVTMFSSSRGDCFGAVS